MAGGRGILGPNLWRLSDDARRTELDARAFTREAWAQLQSFVDAAPPSPSRERIRFLLDFCEATGLRASELVAARLQDLRLVDGCWALAVRGKGARSRVVAVPGQALRALKTYLVARDLPSLERDRAKRRWWQAPRTVYQRLSLGVCRFGYTKDTDLIHQLRGTVNDASRIDCVETALACGASGSGTGQSWTSCGPPLNSILSHCRN